MMNVALCRGSAVGPYLLGKPLGEGASGRVFSAWDRRHGRAVALKVPHAGSSLRDEARALAAIDDPRVVRLVDFGPWRDRTFLAMELLEGRSLKAWLGEAPSRVAILNALAELGRAVVVVHEAGYVHGDLKPANVHVLRDGQVRLLDFGLATTPERAVSSRGTPAYLAPEVFDGAPLSTASDRFAFAVLVYASLAGRRPFAGRNWVMQVLDPQPPCWSAIPEPLRAPLALALRPDPATRLSTLAPLIEALEFAR